MTDPARQLPLAASAPPRLLPRPLSGRLLLALSLACGGASAAWPAPPAGAPGLDGNARGGPTANAAVQAEAPLPQQPDLPPLQAASGVTALSGRVVDLDGRGLPGVVVADNSERTTTDAQGRWVLAPVPVGASVLRIDARRAGQKHERDHGVYEVRVEARPGRTAVLPWVSWLAAVDHKHDVTIPSPTTSEVVVRTPDIPDLELRLPAGTVVRDVDGRAVTRVGITATPFDRLPFPVPGSFQLPVFFTVQPGAACLYSADGGIGRAQMRYPNWGKELPRARATFWRYEPDANGWAPHGLGTVSADGRQVVPDAEVELHDLGSAECDPSTRSHMDPPVRADLRRQRAPKPPASQPPAGK